MLLNGRGLVKIPDGCTKVNCIIQVLFILEEIRESYEKILIFITNINKSIHHLHKSPCLYLPCFLPSFLSYLLSYLLYFFSLLFFIFLPFFWVRRTRLGLPLGPSQAPLEPRAP
jgi:hypothetical protein